MTFFNQKEEVIQIELTQYGKHLLSLGKLKPAYYAFFDDDIIYDGRYSSVEETNAAAVERIKTTPRTKTQYVFTGIEEQVKKNLALIKQSRDDTQMMNVVPQADKHYILTQRLGTSFLGDKKIPAFNASTLKGEIESVKVLQTGSIPNLRIPLLNIKDVEFKISSTRINENSTATSNVNVPVTFSDGSSIYIKEDYLLVELTEENVEDQMKNFDIEMFIVQTDSDSNETLVPLNFDQKFETFKNGILLDSPQMSMQQEQYMRQMKEQDRYRAENYFNILVDQEIEKNLICELISDMRIKSNSMYDTKYDCEEYFDIKASQERQARRDNISSLYDPSFDDEDIKNC